MLTAHTVPGLPSADTLLDRVKGLSPQLVDRQVRAALTQVFSAANTAGLFKGREKKVMNAIDFHDKPFYGDKNTRMVVMGRYKASTCKFFRYATTNIVEQGKRFTLAAMPVSPFTTKDEVLDTLLGRMREYGLKSRLLLLDRQFFTIDVVQFLNEAGSRYLMPAKKNERVKKHIVAYARGKGPSVVDYRMGDKYRGAEGTLVILRRTLKRGKATRRKQEEKSDKDLIKEHIAFLTNLEVKGLEGRVKREVKRLPRWYKKRFGIETSYRVKNEFLVRTSSTSDVVRWFFFALSVILYNVWVLSNVWRTGWSNGRVRGVRVKELLVVVQVELEGYFVGKGPPCFENNKTRR